MEGPGMLPARWRCHVRGHVSHPRRRPHPPRTPERGGGVRPAVRASADAVRLRDLPPAGPNRVSHRGERRPGRPVRGPQPVGRGAGRSGPGSLPPVLPAPASCDRRGARVFRPARGGADHRRSRVRPGRAFRHRQDHPGRGTGTAGRGVPLRRSGRPRPASTRPARVSSSFCRASADPAAPRSGRRSHHRGGGGDQVGDRSGSTGGRRRADLHQPGRGDPAGPAARSVGGGGGGRAGAGDLPSCGGRGFRCPGGSDRRGAVGGAIGGPPVSRPAGSSMPRDRR